MGGRGGGDHKNYSRMGFSLDSNPISLEEFLQLWNSPKHDPDGPYPVFSGTLESEFGVKVRVRVRVRVRCRPQDQELSQPVGPYPSRRSILPISQGKLIGSPYYQKQKAISQIEEGETKRRGKKDGLF